MFSANTSQVSNDVKYIEDFFSAWLRTGTGSSQTVTTGIKENTGALVISKSRSAATDWAWYDTFRGATKDLASNTTAAETTQSQGLTAFNTDGHTWGTLAKVNTSGATYVDFVLKPTPKFFDVVTYTGNGSGTRAISHSLASVPGCVILKRTDTTGNWQVYHQNLTTPNASAASNALLLNDTLAGQNSTAWGSTAPTSTQFTVGSSQNASGGTYVAYLFAHNAGGFGLTGTDNVISCGSFTTDGSGNATVNLGYEPQWYLVKRTDGNGAWGMADIMRGMTVQTSGNSTLFANTSGAESTTSSFPPQPNATGFSTTGLSASAPHIYIAIRRGPMKTPTSGTSVYTGVAAAGNSVVTTNFPVDLLLDAARGIDGANRFAFDRLRGGGVLYPNLISQQDLGSYWMSDSNTTTKDLLRGSDPVIFWNFRRAPNFFDVVCYTATGAIPSNINHNLGVAPELMIIKKRNASDTWMVYAAPAGNNRVLFLNNSSAQDTNANIWNSTTPTASVFTVGLSGSVNEGGSNYVAYLFASCPGVSKVGSYTGTGATQTIPCGFAARFVLIKRRDNTGDWLVWDTARGMVAGTDPRIAINGTVPESNANWVYTDASGFQIVTSNTAVNGSGGSYIYLAIA